MSPSPVSHRRPGSSKSLQLSTPSTLKSTQCSRTIREPRLPGSDLLPSLGVQRGSTKTERKRGRLTHSCRPSTLLLKYVLHLIAIFGAVIILSLNFCGVWIGKELQGPISKDGQKLFALQLTAKVHELFMFASLSHVISSTLLRRLVAGRAIPFASLSAAMRFQDGSYLFSKEFRALCTARLKGRMFLVLLLLLSMILTVTVGPSSATAMTPILDSWPAGDTRFALNTTYDQLWPTFIDHKIAAPAEDAAWVSIEQNLLSYWGHETLGGVLAGPEIVSVPSISSVRTMEVRLRGPFSLYQPELTAVSVQTAAIANAVNSLRLPWYSERAGHCSWARSRINKGLCMYRDIQWTVHALQPVVYTRCLLSEHEEAISFPTLARGSQEPEEPATPADIFLNKSEGITILHGVDLPGEDFSGTSVGVLIRTNAFTASNESQTYACAVDAQWAYADVKSTFLGTPYAVSGSPPGFHAPNITSSVYEGWRVKIDPDWVSQINPQLDPTAANSTAFDKLISAGSAANGDRKVEAVLAVLAAQAMASLGSDAVVQIDPLQPDNVLTAVESAAARLERTPGYHQLTMRTTVTGYAYGLSSTKGIAASSLLSVVILSCYVLTATAFLLSELLSQYQAYSGDNLTDILAIPVRCLPGSEWKNTSGGRSLDTLRQPVHLVSRAGSVELVVGQEQSASKIVYQRLERAPR